MAQVIPLVLFCSIIKKLGSFFFKDNRFQWLNTNFYMNLMRILKK